MQTPLGPHSILILIVDKSPIKPKILESHWGVLEVGRVWVVLAVNRYSLLRYGGYQFCYGDVIFREKSCKEGEEKCA